ncbi:MAG: hypothetical protein KKC99_01825 [Proteobacteria bacterium]|nr:hypothetical protein [Pseudomonadota bacterium]
MPVNEQAAYLAAMTEFADALAALLVLFVALILVVGFVDRMGPRLLNLIRRRLG